MSTAVLAVENVRETTRPAPRPIPLSRVTAVELRKMFDTRSGFWLMASIAITAVLATGAVILWAPDSELTYDTFAAAIGFPMAIILPIVATLSVTSEWNQRSGLTTFTLVPHRGKVIGAKAIGAVLVGVVSMLLAFAIGAVGNLVGSALAGVDTVWDISLNQVLCLLLAQALNLMIGFMLGVLIRNSAGAIVAYFVYSLVLPPLVELLAANASWFADVRPWIDYANARNVLFNGSVTSEQWQQLAVSGTIWFLLPLAIGLLIVRRAEVK
jgi:ABC-2 type transport system permease protein